MRERRTSIRDHLRAESLEGLILLAARTEPLLQRRIVREIGRRHNLAAVPTVLCFLQSSEPSIVAAAADALAEIRDVGVHLDSAGRLLTKLMTEPRWPTSVRDTCAYALGRIGYAGGRGVLIEALRDTAKSVRICAVAALAQLGHADSRDSIEFAWRCEQDDDVKAAMATVLDVLRRPTVAPLPARRR